MCLLGSKADVTTVLVNVRLTLRQASKAAEKSFTVLLLAEILPMQIRAGAVGAIRDRCN